ncbi:S26 family signal peptidase [Sphingopyxis sp.]|uniref:S26 family signal peptidase n=1 Tax=Sphingopyxis sp. TaxID=1908224 RepID=UPI002634EDB7|nr:S26 family signal peptidase [Sphingopyxis sp.]MCW0198850.1 S26 family signal peptidase [Sphingopyxis sp.]
MNERGDPRPAGAELSRPPRLKRLWGWSLALGGLASALATTLLVEPRPRLVWNASASAPVGLYAVGDGAALARGDMVIARVPDEFRMLAARRHYLPGNVPLVKRVAAVPGDEVCTAGARVTVNGHLVARRLDRDGAGRPMPWWSGCVALGPGEYFLLMADSAASFDGRYFGITGAGDIVGKARLLWRR